MKSQRGSGFERCARENCGASQAVCSPVVKIADSLRLCAPPLTTIGDVSGCVHPHHKIADSLRLWALSVLSIRQQCGTSQACCTPMLKIADSLRLCAPPSRKLGHVSGAVHPRNENCRQPQALSTPPHGNLGDVSGCLHPHHKIADSFRLWALSVLSTHQKCGTSQAFCTPMMKIADSLRLCAPPFTKIVGRLRLCAAP